MQAVISNKGMVIDKMSNTDANIFSEKDEGVSKIRRKKPRRNKFVTVSIIIAAAVLCLVIVYIILYKSGFRPYVRIETESGEKLSSAEWLMTAAIL